MRKLKDHVQIQDSPETSLEDRFEELKKDFHSMFSKANEENERLKKRLDEEIENPRPLDGQERSSTNSTNSNSTDSADEVAPQLTIIDLASQIDKLSNYFFELDCRVLECEQYSRRESIVISGIPNDVKHRELGDKVLHILRTIDCDIKGTDISACHRLGNGHNSSHC